MRAAGLLTLAILLTRAVFAGAPKPVIIDPKDGFDVQLPGDLDSDTWRSDGRLKVKTDPNDGANQLVTADKPLGTAWFKPKALPAPGEKVTEDALTVSCDVNLQEDDPAKNVGACFRSAAILVSRGDILVTARVFVTLDTSGDAKQYVEVVVKDTTGGTSNSDRQEILRTAGDKLKVSGRLVVSLPDNSGPVTATFQGETATAAIAISGGKTTHVGIQIRKPSNTDIASPSIDELRPGT